MTVPTWTHDRIALVRRLAADQVHPLDMLDPLNALPGRLVRTEEAVRTLCRKQGISLRSSRVVGREERAERDASIRAMRDDGASWHEIGEAHGISPDWAKDIWEAPPVPPVGETFQPIRSNGACRWVCCHAPAQASGLCAAHEERAMQRYGVAA